LDPEPTGTPGTTPGAFQGLERLGETPGEAPPPPPGENPGEAPPPPPGASPGVAAPPTVRPATRRGRKRRRSTGQRVVRWAILVVVLVLVAAGSVYGYLWYRLGQIKSVRCSTCAAQAPGAPYNVLIVGSDSRAGDSPAASKAFGSASLVGGQRSDTIKILHVNPATGTAEVLSIPRDTYVELSGMPSGTGLATDNKINTAFNSGPDPLIQTIENTFGIPINHFVITSFNGVIDLVSAVGGITLDFPYPVRDNDDGNNNSGLEITHAGCQTLNGNMALALARSRYYEYEVRPGYWEYDGSGDLGRIQRQNVIIEAVIDKARSSSYNPIKVNNFLDSIVHDITKDNAMSTSTLISLAQRFHAFSGSALKTLTLPTLGASSGVAGSIEVVQEPAANEMISSFLGTSPEAIVTPPLDAYGSPVTTPPTTTPSPTTPGTGTGPSSSTTTTVPGQGPFNPTPC
jgi:LCP family protein required for cell wall assembly